MKKYLFSCLFVVLFSCSNQQKKEVLNSESEEKINVVKIRDSLIFNSENEIIDISHYENGKKEGFSIMFDKNTHNPIYLVEYNKGKRDKMKVSFYSNGRMKSLRSSDIYNDSQRMDFYENGVIKSIGNTTKGKSNGIWYYFDKKGKLTSKVLYKEGQKVN